MLCRLDLGSINLIYLLWYCGVLVGFVVYFASTERVFAFLIALMGSGVFYLT
jgi:hypothetical protein